MNQSVAKKISDVGMNLDEVKIQLEYFKNGFPYLPVQAPATIGDGIIKMDDKNLKDTVTLFDEKSGHLEIVKFVPASGAASRMFKSLFTYLEENEVEGLKNEFIQKFIKRLKDFAFYKALEADLDSKGVSIGDVISKGKYHKIVKSLVNEDGLNYGKLPKGLLLFHKYEKEVRTPVAEHFSEGLSYAVGKGNAIKLHFTVSPEHMKPFEMHVAEVQKIMQASNFEVTFSTQKKATDTIAVTMDNQPFENEDGTLLFRPAGHGALLENLNEVDADIIFVKNIDNVVPDKLKEQTILYKKAIAGLLLRIQNKTFEYLRASENGSSIELLNEIELFVKNELNVKVAANYSKLSNEEKIEYLRSKLDRPIRVCGMVQNTGEPGGGPFWVNEKDGSQSLQIAETSQLNLEDQHDANILNSATHFNPVDLVCGVKNYKGEKFNLIDYRDPETGFITIKSAGGRELKALELPGLWNGAMANWNTLFVEVPLITFNPVKTVNDLLRDEHQ